MAAKGLMCADLAVLALTLRGRKLHANLVQGPTQHLYPAAAAAGAACSPFEPFCNALPGPASAEPWSCAAASGCHKFGDRAGLRRMVPQFGESRFPNEIPKPK
jgi:hypothetical protein